MINKIPLRIRLTILIIFLLTSCCVGLTIILNHSAFRMVDIIEAIPLTPAISTDNAADNSVPFTPKPVLTEASKAVRTNYKAKSLIYMGFIVSLGGVFTYYILGKGLIPLKELSSQMKNINVHNLSEDISLPEAKDEIYDLTTSFNEMTHKLNDAFTMQRRFSQNAAHELRTPLSVLKTKVDVFRKKDTHSKEEYDSLIKVVSTHTDRLSSLVKSLLDHTNMDHLNLNENIYICDILQSVVQDLSSLSKDKNIEVKISGEDKIVHGNSVLLYRAFYNLVENAIKYNIDMGTVDLIIEGTKDRTTIEISDTGLGIPDEMKDSVFEPFFRIDKSRSREIGGSGLGLSIVKSIIHKHKGEITITNNEPTGTKIKVFLL